MQGAGLCTGSTGAGSEEEEMAEKIRARLKAERKQREDIQIDL